MKRAILLIMAFLLIISCLAGCNKSDGQSNTGSQSPQLTKITVGSPSQLEVLGYAHWLVADYMGYFAEEGIELVMIPQGGADVCKMMAAGEVDMALPAPALIFPSITAGINQYVIYQHDCTNIFGFAIPADSDIKDWKDLEGKKMATDAGWFMFSDPILTVAGVDIDSITYVSAPDERSVLLASGACDFAFTWQKEWQLWDAQGIPLRYLDGEDVLPNSANPVVCLPEYYENNKALIEGMGRALAKGTYFCSVNPLAGAAITVGRWPTLGLKPEEAMPSVKALVECSTPKTGNYGEAELSRWELALEWLAHYGMVDESKIDLNQILKTSEFLNAFNNWDKAAVKKDAESFDINSVNWNK